MNEPTKDQADAELDRIVRVYAMHFGPEALMESVAFWLTTLVRVYGKPELTVRVETGTVTIRPHRDLPEADGPGGEP